ncbi:MAG: hypothetical protein GX885_02670 [Methanomicrobiales archaeon]|nr:hypothetical protein [Methanomicrobiales archaeon]
MIEAPPIGQGTRVPDLGGDLRDGGFRRRKRRTVGPGVPGAASYHTPIVAPLRSPFRGRDGLQVDASLHPDRSGVGRGIGPASRHGDLSIPSVVIWRQLSHGAEVARHQG